MESVKDVKTVLVILRLKIRYAIEIFRKLQ